MSKGKSSGNEEEKNRKCKEKLYRYSLDVTKNYKIECFENMILKKELTEKTDRIRELENEVTNRNQSLFELQTSLTDELCAKEKLLKEKEQSCDSLLKENEKLKVFVEDEREKYTPLLEENKRLKEEVIHHKNAIDTIMKEAKDDYEKVQADNNNLTEEVQELQSTVQKSKEVLRTSIKWLLQFGERLLQMGYLTEEVGKAVVSKYRSIYNDVEITGKENFFFSSQLDDIPSEVITTLPHPTVVVPELNGSTSLPIQIFSKVDSATSPVHKLPDTVDSAISPFHKSSFLDVPIDKSDDALLSDSIGSSEFEFRQLDFPKEKLPLLPSSSQIKQKKISATSSDQNHQNSLETSFETGNLLGSNSNTRKSPYASKVQTLSHQSSEGFDPSFSASDNHDQIIPKISSNNSKNNEKTSANTTITFATEDNANPEFIITFPIIPTLKKQTVNLDYQEHQVLLGYKRIPKDGSGSATFAQTVNLADMKESCESHHPSASSKKTGDSTTTDDYNRDSQTQMHQKRKRHLSVPSDEVKARRTTRAQTKMHRTGADAHSEKLQSPHKSVDSNIYDNAKDVIGSCDDDQGSMSLTLNGDSTSEMASLNVIQKPDGGKDPCVDVIEALEKLEVLCTQKALHKDLTENLKSALCNIVTVEQAEGTVNATVSFISSRISNPLADFLRDNDECVLFPLDELCLVNAYNMVDNTALLNHLEECIRNKLMMTTGEQLPLSSLAALCRVCSSVQSLEARLEDARRLCYDLFKKNTDMAPYLVASITSVWPEVFHGLATSGSGEFISIVIRYLIANKPSGLDTQLWNQASNILKKYYDSSDLQTPEVIFNLIINAIVANSKPEYYSDQDVFNYTTALELLVSRVDWTWILNHILKNGIFPILDSFIANARRKNCGAVGLCYKLLGIIAINRDKDGVCLEFVKQAISKTLKQSSRIPLFILKYAYQAQYNLHLQHTQEVDKNLQAWFKEHGLFNEETSGIVC